jgi:hypothetical protein
MNMVRHDDERVDIHLRAHGGGPNPLFLDHLAESVQHQTIPYEPPEQ